MKSGFTWMDEITEFAYLLVALMNLFEFISVIVISFQSPKKKTKVPHLLKVSKLQTNPF